MVSHKVLVVARKFFIMADKAMSNGGFWVSAGGGTARIVIAEIARATGFSDAEVEDGLNMVGGDAWYAEYYHRQNQDWEKNHWSVRTIVKAALKGVK